MNLGRFGILLGRFGILVQGGTWDLIQDSDVTGLLAVAESPTSAMGRAFKLRTCRYPEANTLVEAHSSNVKHGKLITEKLTNRWLAWAHCIDLVLN